MTLGTADLEGQQRFVSIRVFFSLSPQMLEFIFGQVQLKFQAGAPRVRLKRQNQYRLRHARKQPVSGGLIQPRQAKVQTYTGLAKGQTNLKRG